MRIMFRRGQSVLLRCLMAAAVFALILLLLSVFLLKHGIETERIEFGSIVVNNAELVWQKKLELKVQTITIENTGDSTDVSELRKLHLLSKIFPIFSLVEIEQLQFNKHQTSIILKQSQLGEFFLNVETEEIIVHSRIDFEQNNIVLNILDATSIQHQIRGSGKISFQPENMYAAGEIHCDFGESFPVTLNFIANRESISFSGRDAGKIENIDPLVELFGLTENIEKWITDYLRGSRYHLKSVQGTIPWNAPGKILKTLKAEVRVDDTEYTFAPGLAPIKAPYTDITFSEGILDIKPHHPKFNGMNGGKSRLDINFTDHNNILLTANIITTAAADDKVATLLNYYDIPFPIKQVSGKTEINLTLTINLNSLTVDVEADFSIDVGKIVYQGKTYSVRDGGIHLKNSELTVHHLKYYNDELLRINISAEVDFRKKQGTVKLTPEQVKIPIGTSFVRLDPEKTPPHITCRFSPSGNQLEMEESFWQFDSLNFSLENFQSPINLREKSIQLSKLLVRAPVGIEAEVSGFLFFERLEYNLNWELLNLEIHDMVLDSTPFPINIRYADKLEILTDHIAEIRLNQVPLKLYPVRLKYEDSTLSVNNNRVSYGVFFDSFFSGYYNIPEKQGEVHLSKIAITEKHLSKDLVIEHETHVTISEKDNNFVLDFPEIDLRITTEKEGNWSAVFSDLTKLSSRSLFLTTLGVEQGNLAISSRNGTLPYSFTASVGIPIPMLIDGDGFQSRLDIIGRLDDKGITGTINKDLHFSYAENRVDLSSNNLGYNLPGVLSFIKDLKAALNSDSRKESPIVVSLAVEDTFLQLKPESRILADRIELQYLGDTLTATLDHGPGRLLLRINGNSFSLGGQGLNDVFMGELIHRSSFTGGEMSLSADGKTDDFTAIIEIDDTVLKNFKTLNNVMAVLNTIPALITFSIPEYSTKGMQIDSAIIGISFKDSVTSFKSIEITSPELQAGGIGAIDFTEGTLDLDINVTTQARKNIRKVPILGYIMTGEEDEPSINLKITGAFDDPQVNYGIVREIATIPYSVIYRTLSLPKHLFEALEDVVD